MSIPLRHLEISTNVRFPLALASLGRLLAAVVLLASPAAAQRIAPTNVPALSTAHATALAALRDGVTHAAGGNWEQARKAFERATAWDAEFTEAHFNLGVALGMLDQPEAAIAAYRRALEIAPTMTDALVNIGIEEFKRQRMREALDALEGAVRRAPDNRPALHNLGVVLGSLGRLDEAIATLTRGLRLAPGDAATRAALADTYYNLGVEHARRHHWHEALASYQTALGFDRSLPEAFNGAGIALTHLHRDTAALAMFGEAVRLRPSFVAARYNLAAALAAAGRYAEAIASCRTALEYQPWLQPAAHLLDSLQRVFAESARISGTW